MSAFREVVTGFQPVFASTEFAGRSSGKVIGKRQEDFRAKRLQQSPPGFTRERGLERADALGGDDGNAPGLAGKAEEFLIAGRVAFAGGSKVLGFITEEQNLPEVPLGMLFHRGHAVEYCALEVEFH